MTTRSAQNSANVMTTEFNGEPTAKATNPSTRTRLRATMLLSLSLAAGLFATSAAADNSSRTMPLLMQTVGEDNAIAEGYANPVETWIEHVVPLSRQSNKRHHFHEPEIWVADIGTLLFNDSDDDGYFAGFSVSIDVDVSWDSADVFAKFYLQPDGVEPNLLHSTNVFTIYEQAISDRYRVDVDLLGNYPAGDYNLIIDVVDASTGRVVDSVSHLTHRNLEDLPLESADFQPHAPHLPMNEQEHGDDFDDEDDYGDDHGDHGHDHDDHDYDPDHDLDFEIEYGLSASVTEYGGASGYALLLAMVAALGLRARRPGH